MFVELGSFFTALGAKNRNTSSAPTQNVVSPKNQNLPKINNLVKGKTPTNSQTGTETSNCKSSTT